VFEDEKRQMVTAPRDQALAYRPPKRTQEAQAQVSDDQIRAIWSPEWEAAFVQALLDSFRQVLVERDRAMLEEDRSSWFHPGGRYDPLFGPEGHNEGEERLVSFATSLRRIQQAEPDVVIRIRRMWDEYEYVASGRDDKALVVAIAIAGSLMGRATALRALPRPSGRVRPGLLPARSSSTPGPEVLPPESPAPTAAQRQRVSQLRRYADEHDSQAEVLEQRAAAQRPRTPERAAQTQAEANLARARAQDARTEAADVQGGRRRDPLAGTTDEDIDQLFDAIERNPTVAREPVVVRTKTVSEAQLASVLRPLMRSQSGNRVVFRVEGAGSRELVHVDVSGNVTIGNLTAGGLVEALDSVIHLNFGDAERAVQYAADNRRGAAIKIFEVDNAFVESLRSVAIPQGGSSQTGLSDAVPRLVDVSAAPDQLEIPADLVPVLQDMIVPGSGRVVYPALRQLGQESTPEVDRADGPDSVGGSR
jgi:hypothetical protein